MGDTFAVAGHSARAELTVIDQRGRSEEIGVPLLPRSPTAEERDALRTELRDRLPDGDDGLADRILREAPEVTSLPLFDALAVDGAGRIWMREFLPGRSTRPWLVVDRDGRGLARVEVPDSVDVLDVGQGALLGRTRDQYDVQYLHVWEIERPDGGPSGSPGAS